MYTGFWCIHSVCAYVCLGCVCVWFVWCVCICVYGVCVCLVCLMHVFVYVWCVLYVLGVFGMCVYVYVFGVFGMCVYFWCVLYVCVCVCVWCVWYMCTCLVCLVCVYVFGLCGCVCLTMWSHVELRSYYQMPSFTLVFETGLFTEPRSCYFSYSIWPASSQDSPICVPSTGV